MIINIWPIPLLDKDLLDIKPFLRKFRYRGFCSLYPIAAVRFDRPGIYPHTLASFRSSPDPAPEPLRRSLALRPSRIDGDLPRKGPIASECSQSPLLHPMTSPAYSSSHAPAHPHARPRARAPTGAHGSPWQALLTLVSTFRTLPIKTN
jgi:hypothetical protein